MEEKKKREKVFTKNKSFSKQIWKAALQVGPVTTQTLGPAKDVLSHHHDSSNTEISGSARGALGCGRWDGDACHLGQ